MDSPTHFVESVPEDVIQWFKKTEAITADSAKILIEKLLTHEEMEIVWAKLTKLGFRDRDGKSDHPIWFLFDLTNLYSEWERLPVKTGLQLEKEAQQMLLDLRSLAERIEKSKFDLSAEIPVFKARQAWLETRGYVYDSTKLAMVQPGIADSSIPIYSAWPFDEPTISTVLLKIAEVVETFNYGTESLVKQPKSPGERNRYFCRQLSAYFTSRYGTPLHELTASIHNSLFENLEMDAKSVQKLVVS